MEIFSEIYKSTELGIQTIDNIFDNISCAEFKKLLTKQKEKMQTFNSISKEQLSAETLEKTRGFFFQKTMMKASATINIMMEDSISHGADLLIKGYNTGIINLQESINNLNKCDCEVPPTADALIKFYDKSMKALRPYL